MFSVQGSCSTSQRCSSCPGERQTSRSHFIFMETSRRVMASGLSFRCGVALSQHLNPCPYTNSPKSGRDGAGSSLWEHVLVPGSVLSHLIPILGCCLTYLPAAFPSLWRSRAPHVTPGSVGRSHQVPAGVREGAAHHEPDRVSAPAGSSSSLARL